MFFKRVTLKHKMYLVNSHLSTISAHAGSLRILLDYTGELPVVPPFTFEVTDGPAFHIIYPSIEGERLSSQHLTAAQMAKCISFLPELTLWKDQMEAIYKSAIDAREQREREGWRQQDIAESTRKAQYEADVRKHLG